MIARWRVYWGCREERISSFYTEYHAEQFLRALLLNGTPARIAEMEIAR